MYSCSPVLSVFVLISDACGFSLCFSHGDCSRSFRILNQCSQNNQQELNTPATQTHTHTHTHTHTQETSNEPCCSRKTDKEATQPEAANDARWKRSCQQIEQRGQRQQCLFSTAQVELCSSNCRSSWIRSEKDGRSSGFSNMHRSPRNRTSIGISVHTRERERERVCVCVCWWVVECAKQMHKKPELAHRVLHT